jgi:hypothetical protein
LDLEESVKEKVLISFVGLNDPIGKATSSCQYSDGPILSLTKAIKPNVIYLLITEKTKENINYISKHLKNIKDLPDNFVIKQRDLISDTKTTDSSKYIAPHDFNSFPVIHKIISEIEEQHTGSDIYANISSGTPQMLIALAVDICLNVRQIKCEQVESPSPYYIKDKEQNKAEIKEVEPGIYEDIESKNRVKPVEFKQLNGGIIKKQIQIFLEHYEYHNVKKLWETLNIYEPKFDLLIDEGIKYNKNSLYPNNKSKQIVVAIRRLRNSFDNNQIREFTLLFESIFVDILTLFYPPTFIKHTGKEPKLDVKKIQTVYPLFINEEKFINLTVYNLQKLFNIMYPQLQVESQIINKFIKGYKEFRNVSAHQLEEISSFSVLKLDFSNNGENLFSDIAVLYKALDQVFPGNFTDLTDDLKFKEIYELPSKINQQIVEVLDRLL